MPSTYMRLGSTVPTKHPKILCLVQPESVARPERSCQRRLYVKNHCSRSPLAHMSTRRRNVGGRNHVSTEAMS